MPTTGHAESLGGRIGDLVRHLRRSFGLTQATTATKFSGSRLELSQSDISRIENGRIDNRINRAEELLLHWRIQLELLIANLGGVSFQRNLEIARSIARIDRNEPSSSMELSNELKVVLLEIDHLLRRLQSETSIAASGGTEPVFPDSSAPSIRRLLAKDARLAGRSADLEQVLNLVSPSLNRVGLGSCILYGLPGVGKTALTLALPDLPQSKSAFPQGIVWSRMGEDGTPFRVLRDWAAQLNVDCTGISTVDELAVSIRLRTANGNVLFIADDIWDRSAAVLKQAVVGSNAILLSTRLPELAFELSDVPGELHRLAPLDGTSSLEVISMLCPTFTKAHESEAHGLLSDLAEVLEGLPLALRIAGRLLESETVLAGDGRHVIDEIKDTTRLLGELAPADRADARTGSTPTLEALLRQTSRRLSSDDLARFASLGVFRPRPATFDASAARALWAADSHGTLRSLVGLGLLELASERYHIHQVIAMYAQLVERQL